MDEHVRSLDGRAGEDPKRLAREVIYDMAVTGKTFHVYDVLEALDGKKVEAELIAHALRAAALVGLIVEQPSRSVHVPVTPEDWVAGKPPIKRKVKVYRGNAKISKEGAK